MLSTEGKWHIMKWGEIPKLVSRKFTICYTWSFHFDFKPCPWLTELGDISFIPGIDIDMRVKGWSSERSTNT